MTDCERFELAEALHCYLTLNHEGQSSFKYLLLCKSEFRPGPMWSESRCEIENDIYPTITEENFEALFYQCYQEPCVICQTPVTN